MSYLRLSESLRRACARARAYAARRQRASLVSALALLAGCGVLAAATPVAADATVVVLGLRSIEGDDDVANDLTEQLRSAAGTVEGYALSATAVSMAQMSLAHGCDELDASCLSEIATGLRADRIIYGTVRRTSAHDDYDFAVRLSLFDAEQDVITKEVDDTIPRDQASYEALASRADNMVRRLTSTLSGGAIAIQVNVDDATVRVNGQHAGDAHDGTLRLEGLDPGQYRIEVDKDGYAPHQSTVTVLDGSETTISAVLVERTVAYNDNDYPDDSGGGHQLEWLGWTLIGVGGAAAIGTGVSFAVIQGIDDDELFNEYRDAVERGNIDARAANQQEYDDVCVAARRGDQYSITRSELEEVVSMCDTADTFEVLQWVFLGTAVVSTGVGLYLVLTAEDAPDDASGRHAGPSLAVTPSIAPDSASVRATLRF